MAPTLHNTDLSFDRFVAELSSLSNDELSELIGSGSILDEPAFSMGRSSDLAAFYAPFDWINEDANIVLLGVTPGKQQAEAALAALRHSLRSGSSVGDAMRIAKQSASFAGEMRTIATRLMDRFRMNDLFGLASASELFGRSSNRVHYTSVYRYPVLKKKAANWINYPGGTSRADLENPLLQGMVRDYLIPELKMLANAWLVPFGPTPATILAELSEQGIVDSGRVLAGLNHPSGTQWNRHKCELGLVNHDLCAANVGCGKIQARSRELRAAVSAHLGGG